MSFATWAAALVGAKPVYLYKITKGSESAYYTSRMADYSAAPASLTVDFFEPADFFSRIDFFAETFSKRPIAHSAIKLTQNSAKRLVTISLPRTDSFGSKFIGPQGIESALVTVWKGFENDVDGEFPRMFLGEVRLVKPTFATVSIVCDDSGSIIKGKGIADVIQRPCRHALYHGKCGLALSAWEAAGSATAMSSSVVTVTEAASQADGYYSGGIISYGTSLQFITSHTGAALTVLSSVGDLESDIAASGAKAVTIAPGCDRSMTVCDGVFNNSENHGGFEQLTDSPFDGRSVT